MSYIAEANTLLAVERVAPGFIAVGTDGGDGVIVVRADDDKARPFIVDAGSMRLEHLSPLDYEWDTWYARKCPIESSPPQGQVRVLARWALTPTTEDIAALRRCIPGYASRPITDLRIEFSKPGEYELVKTLPHLATCLQNNIGHPFTR